MFYERTDMVEMYELAATKKDWGMVLVTAEIKSGGEIKKDEFKQLLNQWALKVRGCMVEKDAAYRINDGNVFVLSKQPELDLLLKKLRTETSISNADKPRIDSSVLRLSTAESDFLLQI